MNIRTNAIAVFLLLFAAAAPVTAEVSECVATDVRLAVSQSQYLNVVVKGDTVILSGYVEDSYARGQAERAAKRAGATRVINRLFTF